MPRRAADDGVVPAGDAVATTPDAGSASPVARTRDVWLAVAGVALAWFFYLRRPDIPALLQRRFAFLYRVLDNKYYMDWFNEHVLARGARLLGLALWKGGDVAVIDGVVIDGSAAAVGGFARATRMLQSGYLYWYALVMIVGVIGLMTWQLWPFLANVFVVR